MSLLKTNGLSLELVSAKMRALLPRRSSSVTPDAVTLEERRKVRDLDRARALERAGRRRS